MPDYVGIPIPTLVPQKRRSHEKRHNRKLAPVIHPGVVRQPLHWRRHKPVVQLVPPLHEREPDVQIRKVG